MSYPSDDEVVDLDDMNDEIWKQHPEETDKAYRAFQAFRDLGRERSKMEAYLMYSGKSREDFSGDSAPTHIYKWAKKYQWNERAKAWDNHQDELKEEKYEEEMLEYYGDVIEYAQSSSNHLLEALDAQFSGKSPKEKADLVFGEQSMDLEGFARCFTQLNNIADKAFGNFTEDDESQGEVDFLAEIRKLDE